MVRLIFTGNARVSYLLNCYNRYRGGYLFLLFQVF
jgi:hypothetical protein